MHSHRPSLPSDTPGPVAVLAAGLLAALLPLLSCGVTDLDRDAEAAVQTSELEYTLRETEGGDGLEAEIPFRYDNRSAASICMNHCDGAYGIALVDASGETVWSAIVPQCLSPDPVTIDPGETFRDTLRLFHGLEANHFPKIEDGPEGVYRIDVASASRSASGDGCGGEPVPEDERRSNRFRLVKG